MAGVEFIGAEESSGPVEDSGSSGGNQRWYLLLSAVVLAVIAVAVGRSANHDKTAPTPVRTSSASAAPTRDARPTTDPARCPSQLSCAASSTVPAPALAALADEFPDATVGPTATVRVSSRWIWFRQLTARIGPLHLVVRIQLPQANPATLGPSRDDTLETYVRQDKHGYVVQIDADGPVPGVPDIRKLYRLATDPRLYTAG